MPMEGKVSINVRHAKFNSFQPVILLLRQNLERSLLEPSGSAFPVFYRGCLYLITAAHCVSDLNDQALFICGEHPPISLAGSFIQLNQTLDVAVIMVDSRVLAKYASHWEVIFSDDGRSSDPEYEAFQMFGYPQSKNKMNPHHPSGAYDRNLWGVTLGPQYTGKISPVVQVARENLLIRELSEKNLIDDNLVRSNKLKEFYGFSGGPIIRFGLNDGRLFGLVAGVTVEFHKQEKALIGIGWSAIEEWISTL